MITIIGNEFTGTHSQLGAYTFTLKATRDDYNGYVNSPSITYNVYTSP